MADGFGRVPVEAEVTPGDREVGGDGEFLSWARTEQGAVVANTEGKGIGGGGVRGASADATEQGQFAGWCRAARIGPLGAHSLRIGQAGGGVDVVPGARNRSGLLNLRCWRTEV